tara:strand:- start:16872 stop:17486 length:615 start_codon:yes stop_codon:yes gene_type:complete
MITILNYGTGNVNSIKKAFYRLGIDSQISSNKKVIQKSHKLILPGVGHFNKGMQNLRKSGFYRELNHLVLNDKIPVLGICLGMQLMTMNSEEGNVDGLGWIDANVKSFDFLDNENKLKIPHIGWNNLKIEKKNNLYYDISESDMFYFVHSYYTSLNNGKDSISLTRYGIDFVSSFQKDNIFGVQFHPEKSHDQGLKILKNFASI